MIDLTDIGTSTKFSNGKADAMGMITPLNIVKDMMDLEFEHIAKSNTDKHIKEYRFIDICCKSGNFLRQIYVKLMEHPDMINEFEDRDYRSEYILNNMIYGICFCESDTLISTRNVYGRLVKDSHIVCISNWVEIVKNRDIRFVLDKIKETFGDMKFDIVIGNPPYNNDMYLDFVQLGKKLVGMGQHSSVCMITPAKWQAKGGEKNEAFRREIVPYMNEIVYYPYCKDIFDITCHGGITYYLIDKQKHNNSKLSVRHKNEDVFIQDCDTQYSNEAYSLYGDFIEKFIDKIINGNKQHLYVNRKLDGVYKCKILHVYSGNLSGLNCMGGMIIAPIEISTTNDIKSDHYVIYSGKMEECESFKSYLYTKFVRFCLALGVHTQHFNNDEAWRFVPDPGKFDHIFTDEELYQKYGLTDEEIAIIESVIKERK